MDQSFAVVLFFTTIAFVFLLIWIVVVLPQSRARKTQQQVVEDLKVGDDIVTVGGLVGKLTALDREQDIARIEIAKGVEVRIIPAAISHPLDYVQRLKQQERGGTAAGSQTRKK
jgi:preprotein translocase subunit YajC